jgi:ribonuclease HI
MEINVFTDGGARGNPGPAAVGIVIIAGESKNFISKYIGETTNNDAEYQAVIEALLFLTNHKNILVNITLIKFFLDSNLVVQQLNGMFKVKNPKLREHITKIRILEQNVNINIIYSYIPREQNHDADQLVNQALDKQVVL